MSVNVNVISLSINTLVYMLIEDIPAAKCEDIHLQELRAYIIQGWPHVRDEVNHDMRQYWPIRNKLAIDQWHYNKGK